eukprot:7378739-Prymnesium_polylepis.1
MAALFDVHEIDTSFVVDSLLPCFTWAGENCTARAAFPACPTTTYQLTGEWGECSAYEYGCDKFQGYYDSSNKFYMDW